MWLLRAATAYQVKYCHQICALIDLLIMFKHFLSQDHVRTKKKKIFFMNHSKNSRGIFMKLFSFLIIYAHNALTQLNTIFFCVFTFFSLPSFSKPERDGLWHKNSRMRNTQGKSSHFTFFFLSFFSGYSKWKKKNQLQMCLCTLYSSKCMWWNTREKWKCGKIKRFSSARAV